MRMPCSNARMLRSTGPSAEGATRSSRPDGFPDEIGIGTALCAPLGYESRVFSESGIHFPVCRARFQQLKVRKLPGAKNKLLHSSALISRKAECAMVPRVWQPRPGGQA